MTPSLLLPFNQDNPAITTVTHAQNLLLLSVQDDPAITVTNHANPKLQIVECLFLRCNEDNSETMTSSLLLFCVKDAPAIMTAPLANFLLQLIVESFPTGAKEASVCKDSSKLIVNVIPASEGATMFLYILGDHSFNETTKFTVVSQAMFLSMTIGDKSNGSFKLQKLIVDCISSSYSEGARLAPTNTFRTSIANFQLIVEHPILP